MNPYPSTPSPPGRWSKPSIIVEDILIVLSIGALWFTVLDLSGPIYFVIQLAALGAMIAVFVRRLRRFKKTEEDRP